MKFAQPIWLIAGLIACGALLWRYRRFDVRQRSELAKFASESLLAQLTTSVSARRRYFKRVLVVLGVACVAVALARPLGGLHWQETKRKGLPLLFPLGNYKSISCPGVKPEPLPRPKKAVEKLPP